MQLARLIDVARENLSAQKMKFPLRISLINMNKSVEKFNKVKSLMGNLNFLSVSVQTWNDAVYEI